MKKISKKVLFALLAFSLSFTGLLTSVGANEKNNGPKVKLGIEVLMDEEIDLIKGKNVGLITNPTGVDNNMNSTVDLLFNHPDVNLVALYGPEHGVRGDAQAGASIESYVDEHTGLTVYSLYGKTQKATPEMLEGVDTLIFDIQDAGARFYTYIYTMYYALEAASENDIQIIILDRPNPINGLDVQGPVMEPGSTSFIGLIEGLPTRHGMTVAELALYYNDVVLPEKGIEPADLKVVKMQGWNRNMYFEDTGLHFVLPSPNMPTPETAIHYVGTALFERIHIAEGRGTTKPFELIGAKYINAKEYADALNNLNLPGVLFRAASFTPVSANQNITTAMTSPAHGVELFITDLSTYDPIRTTLHMIDTLNKMYPNPEKDGTGFYFTTGWDKLMGNQWVEQRILAGVPVEDIIAEWTPNLEAFKEVRQNYLLYGTTLVKDELETEVTKAQALDLELYKEESTVEFTEALQAALTVLEDDNAVQAHINKALERLAAAELALELKDPVVDELDTTALEAAIAQAEAAKEEDFTPETFAALQTELEAAKEMLAKALNKEVTQDQVDAMTLSLVKAFNELEAVDGAVTPPEEDKEEDKEQEDINTGILSNSIGFGILSLASLGFLTHSIYKIKKEEA